MKCSLECPKNEDYKKYIHKHITYSITKYYYKTHNTFISKQQEKLCWTEFLNKSYRIQSYSKYLKKSRR